MANPAILVGLLAGYTVAAVATALAVAHDDPPRRLTTRPALDRSPSATCARVLGTGRGVTRCLRSAGRSGQLSSPRR